MPSINKTRSFLNVTFGVSLYEFSLIHRAVKQDKEEEGREDSLSSGVVQLQTS